MDFTFLKVFCDTYGASLLMLIGQGCLIAFMIELAIKKGYDTNIARAEGEVKAKLMRNKTRICVIASVIASAFAALSVMKGMLLPGGLYLFGAWFGIVFVVQYAVSMKGLKYFIEKIESAFTKKTEKTSKPKTSKKAVKLNEGEKLYKKLDDGTIVEV